MAGGRTVMEMAAYSPPAEGLWNESADGMGRHVFVGWPQAALGVVAVLLGTGPKRWRRRGAEVPGWALWAVAGMSVLVVLVALGINGWPCGFWARAARKAIPKFAMIRQTAKILCLLPPLAAAGLGLAFGGIFAGGAESRGSKKRREAQGAAKWIPGLGARATGVFAVLAALTNLEQVRAGLCVLPGRLSAYEAVAADAAAEGLSREAVRAVSLPIWPGDSHWSSLYEYAITESGIRHLNGYAPATPAGYGREVFAKFESLNQGWATEEQWDALLGLGVRYVLFHGNAWEEKVSPWPPAVTLRRLMGDARLRPLNAESEGQVFAFRILEREEEGERKNWEDGLWGASRQWVFGEEGRRVEAGGEVAFTQRAPIFPAPGLRLMMRLAEAQPSPMGVDLEGKRAALAGQSEGLPGWQTVEWLSPKGVRAKGDSGAFTVRRAYLAAGPDWEADADGVWRAEPATMWHTGTSRPGEAGVSFAPETTGAGLALWGPNLAVPEGTYEAGVAYESEEAGNGFAVRRAGGAETLAEVALPPGSGVAGTGPLMLDDSPVRFEVVYRGKGRLRVERLELAPARFELKANERKGQK